MASSSQNLSNEEFERLFKEHQACREDASRLESYIWKTAGLLGIASTAGLVLRTMENSFGFIHLVGTMFVAMFAINLTLVWWRFARRWWSIQHLKFQRIDEIEKLIGFGRDVNVGERDIEAMADRLYIQNSRPFLRRTWTLLFFDIPPEYNIEKRESTRARTYEYRGNQPAAKILVLTNISLWLLLALGEACYKGLLSFVAAVLIFTGVALVDIWFWRKP